MLPQRSGAREQKTIRPASLMGAAPQGVVKKGGGSVRVYSNLLGEENGNLVEGSIESRGS